jgi:hypothetical protein
MRMNVSGRRSKAPGNLSQIIYSGDDAALHIGGDFGRPS